MSSDDNINPRSRSGSSSQPWAAANQSDSEREKFGLNAMAPLLSDGSPQPSRISCVRTATARIAQLAGEVRPATTARCPHRMTASPRGGPRYRASAMRSRHCGARSASARANSSALRTRLSTTTDRIALVAEAFVPLRNRSPAMPVTR